MRNQFFPRRKAEYMTRGRFAELGLTKNDIGERDFSFRPEVEEVEEFYDDAVEAVAFGGAASLNAPVDNVWTRAKAEAEAAAAQALELDQVVVSFSPSSSVASGFSSFFFFHSRARGGRFSRKRESGDGRIANVTITA